MFVGYQCTKKWAKPRGSDVSKAAVLEKLIKERDELVGDVEYKNWRIEQLNVQIGEMK